jgi:hypothetical protein
MITRDGALAMSAIDSDDVDKPLVGGDVVFAEDHEEYQDALPKIGTPNYFRFASKIARVVKCKMGLPRPTEANRLVAYELVSKELKANDVRAVDVCKFQAIAVDMVFIPTKYDVLANQIRGSHAIARRMDEMRPRGSRFWNGLARWIAGTPEVEGLRYTRA